MEVHSDDPQVKRSRIDGNEIEDGGEWDRFLKAELKKDKRQSLERESKWKRIRMEELEKVKRKKQNYLDKRNQEVRSEGTNFNLFNKIPFVQQNAEIWTRCHPGF